MDQAIVKQVFFIAEAGVNHNGDVELAKRLIEIAAESGADAVKFQTFKAENLVTSSAVMADYQRKNMGKESSQYEMLKALELANEHHHTLAEHSEKHGIQFLSTPFDEGCADFLETLGLSAFKIASGELTNLPFLQYVARKGIPMIVSTGMSKIGEVEAAVEAIEAVGMTDLTLLHCVSNYPAAAIDINLRAMHTLASFGYPVGYSDHTLGIGVSIAAVAMGATVIEKHFTSDRGLPGPDHRASLEPNELNQLVREIRDVSQALGSARKRPAASELNTAKVARKSLVAATNLPVGHVLTPADFVARRPGDGISPARFDEVLGRRLRVAVDRDTLLDWGLFE